MIYFDNEHNAYGDLNSLGGKTVVFSCTYEMWQDFNQNPLKYVWNMDEIILNANYDEELAQKAKEERKSEIKSELEALDAEAIRPLRAVAADTATDEDIQKLKDIECQVQTLREELKKLY